MGCTSNICYDVLVVNYLEGIYRKLPTMKKDSFENDLKECFNSSKTNIIREKLLTELKSKIKD